MKLDGREIELDAIRYYYQDEAISQDGIMVHYSSDEFCDGDTIYGNGWTLDQINDTDDLRSLLSDTCGTTYWTRLADGLYRVDA